MAALVNEDKHPSIYLSRLSVNNDDETLAWSGPQKARTYIEDCVPGGVDNWETELSDHVQVAVSADEEIVAGVERINLADPASLASTIEKYPSPRQIIDPELIDEGG